MRVSALVAAGLLVLGSAAQAHVTVDPKEAMPGDTQQYTLRVPTEGNSPTVSVELAVPADVKVEPSKDGKYEIKQADGRTVVAWKVNIPAGKSENVKFTATNPDKDGELLWRVVQNFADGSKTAWIEPAGSKQPAPVTKIVSEQYLSPAN